MIEVRVGDIEVKVGDVTVKLTREEARQLRDKLDAALCEKVTYYFPQVYPVPYQPKGWWQNTTGAVLTY